MDALNLFADHKLLRDAEQRRTKFKNFIMEADQRINEAKEYLMMSDNEKKIKKALDVIFLLKSQSDFTQLVAKMMELQDESDNLLKLDLKDQTEKQHNDILIEKIHASHAKTVQELAENNECEAFFKFGYELRKQDNGKGYYTKKLLSCLAGRSILADIIKANYWDAKNEQMQARNNIRFRFLVDDKLYLQYNSKDNYNKSQSIFNRKQVNSGCSNEFQILLTAEGIQIGRLMERTKKDRHLLRRRTRNARQD